MEMIQNTAYDIADQMLDFFYAQRQEEAERRLENIQRRKELRIRRHRLCLGTLVLSVFLSGATAIVYLNMQLFEHSDRVGKMQEQLSSLQDTNKESMKRLEDSIDYLSIIQKAKGMGMSYANQGSIVYYSIPDDEYMIQTQDIPSK